MSGNPRAILPDSIVKREFPLYCAKLSLPRSKLIHRIGYPMSCYFNSAWKLILVLTPIVFLAGCSVNNEGLQELLGPSVRVESTDVETYAANYIAVQRQLLDVAHLRDYPERGSPAWDDFVDAGIGYVNDRCGRFISAVSRYEKRHNLIRREIEAVGGTTGEILAQLTDTAKIINVTAAAFKLATRTSDNFHDSIILVLPAEVIKTVEDQRTAWTNSYTLNRVHYRSSTSAMNAIAAYLSICLPENIEASIKNTLQVARYQVTAPNGKIEPVLISNKPSIAAEEFHLPKDARNAPLPRFSQTGSGTLPPPSIINPLGTFEPSLSLAEAKVAQRRLCVMQADGNFGDLGSLTRQNLKALQYVSKAKQTGVLEKGTYVLLRSLDDCTRTTIIEHYIRSSAVRIGEFNEVLIAALERVTPTTVQPPENEALIQKVKDLVTSIRTDTSKFTGDTKTAIETFQILSKLKKTGELTPDTYRAILTAGT